jgi:hypothetical protein
VPLIAKNETQDVTVNLFVDSNEHKPEAILVRCVLENKRRDLLIQNFRVRVTTGQDKKLVHNIFYQGPLSSVVDLESTFVDVGTIEPYCFTSDLDYINSKGEAKKILIIVDVEIKGKTVTATMRQNKHYSEAKAKIGIEQHIAEDDVYLQKGLGMLVSSARRVMAVAIMFSIIGTGLWVYLHDFDIAKNGSVVAFIIIVMVFLLMVAERILAQKSKSIDQVKA